MENLGNQRNRLLQIRHKVVVKMYNEKHARRQVSKSDMREKTKG